MSYVIDRVLEQQGTQSKYYLYRSRKRTFREWWDGVSYWSLIGKFDNYEDAVDTMRMARGFPIIMRSDYYKDNGQLMTWAD